MMGCRSKCKTRRTRIERNGALIEMILYTKKEIQTLIKTGITIEKVYLVRLQDEFKKVYQVEFVVPSQGHEQRAMLITTRNTPNHWSDLTRAVDFVEGLFVGVKKIEITLGPTE